MERKNGYYWVKFKTIWMIALYSNETGWLAINGQFHKDSNWSKINDTRILAPNEIEAILSSTLDSPSSPSELDPDIITFVKSNQDLYDIFFEYFRANE